MFYIKYKAVIIIILGLYLLLELVLERLLKVRSNLLKQFHTKRNYIIFFIVFIIIVNVVIQLFLSHSHNIISIISIALSIFFLNVSENVISEEDEVSGVA